jgi:hypothetical protein
MDLGRDVGTWVGEPSYAMSWVAGFLALTAATMAIARYVR